MNKNQKKKKMKYYTNIIMDYGKMIYLMDMVCIYG